MAKVMISVPDRLLERIDARASSAGETRSGFLRRLAERELEAGEGDQRQRLEELLGPPVSMGGNAAELIREARDSR